jgi:hypothetical protein
MPVDWPEDEEVRCLKCGRRPGTAANGNRVSRLEGPSDVREDAK